MSPFLPIAYSLRKLRSPSGSTRFVTAWCVTAKPSAEGFVSTALIHRSSVSPDGDSSRPNQSGASGATTYGSGIGTIRSGSPICQSKFIEKSTGGGMSAGFPRGAPLSTQRTMVVISSSLSDLSSLKPCTPMFLSMNHGGILRVVTFSLIDLAQGRACS